MRIFKTSSFVFWDDVIASFPPSLPLSRRFHEPSPDNFQFNGLFSSIVVVYPKCITTTSVLIFVWMFSGLIARYQIPNCALLWRRLFISPTPLYTPWLPGILCEASWASHTRRSACLFLLFLLSSCSGSRVGETWVWLLTFLGSTVSQQTPWFSRSSFFFFSFPTFFLPFFLS